MHTHQYSNIIQYVACKAHGLFSFGTYLQDQNGNHHVQFHDMSNISLECLSARSSVQQHHSICHMQGSWPIHLWLVSVMMIAGSCPKLPGEICWRCFALSVCHVLRWGPQSFCWIGREFAYTAATFARRNDAMTCNSSCNRRRITTSRLWHRGTSTVARGKRCPRLPFQPVQLWQWECALETCIWSEGLKVFRWRRLCELCSLHALACNTLVELKSPASAQTGHV